MISLFDRDKIVELGEKVNNLPVISIYLDTSKTRPDAKQVARWQAKDFFQEMKNLPEVKESKDLKRMVEDYEEEVLEYIDANFSNLKNGLVMFLAGDDNLFEVIELPRPVKNRYYFDKQAEVKPLLAYMDEYEKILWIVMDRRKAKVYVEYMGDIVEIEDLIDSFWDFIPDTDKAWYFVRPAAPGGGYAENADKEEGLLRAYVNNLSNELIRLKEKLGYTRLVVFVPEKLKHIVEEDLHRDLKAILAKVYTGNYTKANKNVIRDLIVEVEKELEREEEEKMIDEVYNNTWNSEYKKWVYGLKDVLKHLNQGAVWYLLIQENIEFPGYIGKDSGFLYTSEDENELWEELIPVKDLTNDIITKAIDQDARVNFIPQENEKLQKLWNIAAMVRFKL
jgi:peptide subunit release factor 1 (eRF1)